MRPRRGTRKLNAPAGHQMTPSSADCTDFLRRPRHTASPTFSEPQKRHCERRRAVVTESFCQINTRDESALTSQTPREHTQAPPYVLLSRRLLPRSSTDRQAAGTILSMTSNDPAKSHQAAWWHRLTTDCHSGSSVLLRVWVTLTWPHSSWDSSVIHESSAPFCCRNSSMQ